MKKQSKMNRHLTLALCALTLIYVTGCSSAKKKEGDGGFPNAAAADENLMGDSDSGRAMGLQTVHFPYDSFTLDQKAKSVLKSNADILNSKSNVKVQIEGHCDQRGGIQYNIALGEKRANATRKYMQDLGVNASQMTVISFGKEKLVDPGMSEEAYAKNRRANFVITSQ